MDKNDLEIRPYIQNDYPGIKKMLLEQDLYSEDKDNQSRIEKKVARDWKSIFIALHNNEVVGMVSIMEDGRNAFIFRPVVTKNTQTTKIGHRLMHEAEEELFARGYTGIKLIDEKDQRLREFYQERDYDEGQSHKSTLKEKG